jgi:hypothetical protein
MISAFPARCARTIPPLLTLATVVSVDFHWSTPRISRFPWLGTTTRSVSTSSGASSSRLGVMANSACATSTGSVAMSRPEVACTIVRPGATPLTRPPESTRAISGRSDLIMTRPIDTGFPSSR